MLLPCFQEAADADLMDTLNIRQAVVLEAGDLRALRTDHKVLSGASTIPDSVLATVRHDRVRPAEFGFPGSSTKFQAVARKLGFWA